MLLYFYLYVTRKYPLRGYTLGVLTNTTAWDQHWRNDETLKCGFEIDYTYVSIKPTVLLNDLFEMNSKCLY